MQNLIDYIQNVSDDQIYLVYLIVIFISFLIYLVTNRIILKLITHFFKKTSTYVDDILIEKKVFNKIPYLMPLIFIYNLKDLLPWFRAIEKILLSVFALIILITLNAFIVHSFAASPPCSIVTSFPNFPLYSILPSFIGI